MNINPENTARTKKKILFVCTGNSCRSVMAEGLLKKRLQELKRDDIEVSSAGVGAINGMKPTENTVAVMREEGVDVTEYQARYITDDMMHDADLILVMERMHKDAILMRAPWVARKIRLLKDFAQMRPGPGSKDAGIQDPISKPLEMYREVKEIIKKNIEEIVDKI